MIAHLKTVTAGADSPGVLWLAATHGRPLFRNRAHARGHLVRYVVIEEHVAQVAQSAGLPLHDEMPQCNASLRDERGAQLPAFSSRTRLGMAGVERGQCSEACFKCAPSPAECRNLLLEELVRKQVCRCVPGLESCHWSLARAEAGSSAGKDRPVEPL